MSCMMFVTAACCRAVAGRAFLPSVRSRRMPRLIVVLEFKQAARWHARPLVERCRHFSAPRVSVTRGTGLAGDQSDDQAEAASSGANPGTAIVRTALQS
jgi:hypothetical protein